jgi:hypothetical protein
LPHLLIKDDIYKNYHLPAGSIVMVNVWYAIRSSVNTFTNPSGRSCVTRLYFPIPKIFTLLVS